jgi:RND family efflux transporter MFP subunit
MRRGVCWTVCFLGLLGCGHESAPPSAEGAIESAEVAVAVPQRKTIRYTVEQPGRVEPFEQTPIYAKIAGYVRSVRVEIGDRVKRGDLLAELDVPELVEEGRRKQALVEQARLGITQAEQAARVAEANLISATAAVDVARAALGKAVAAHERWRMQYQRMDKLAKEKVMDRQTREEALREFRTAEAAEAEARARIRAAEAELAESQARRDKLQADLAAARNHLAVAESEEREVKAMLAYVRIAAPYDGVVSDRRVHTGHFLQAATGGTKGEPLFTVVRTDKVRVFVEVPEADAVEVHRGSPGRIRVQVLNDREFAGKVRGTAWSLDPSQRTLRTEIDFDNPDEMLRPGMYVHALIDVERPKSWVIPAGAVLVRDALNFCYVVRDDKTHRLPLRPGLRDGELIEVLKVQAPPLKPGDSPRWVDLRGGESIVTTKPGELHDNQPVRVRP